jgi:hypothetical protein
MLAEQTQRQAILFFDHATVLNLWGSQHERGPAQSPVWATLGE